VTDITQPVTPADFLAAVKFDDKGLVPVIAQRDAGGEVLMLAWMTRQTLETTLASGDVTYWSRSRQKVWRKGETSGHTQRLVEALLDCDGDVVLLKVDQVGPACHTGTPSCFFRKLERRAAD
jgi:phosphoribosyl-AMP cyclohydrolase